MHTKYIHIRHHKAMFDDCHGHGHGYLGLGQVHVEVELQGVPWLGEVWKVELPGLWIFKIISGWDNPKWW